MKLRWIVLTLVAAAALGAASWGLGLWDSPPAEEAATPTVAPPAPSKLAPMRTAAWMLANAKPTAPAVGRSEPALEVEEDAGCGASSEPCPEGSICLDGGCLSPACSTDGGAIGRCALAGAKIGVCCGERCADLAHDNANCGQCGLSCAGGMECLSGTCLAPSCTGRMAGTACLGAGKERGACCRGGCVDRSAWLGDSASCGGCGHACAPGLACKQGVCVDAATGAPPSFTCLDDGHSCPAGTFCVIDACFPRACTGENDGLLCPGPSGGELGHCCGQVCADLFDDKDNCRACGVHCPPGEVCKSGECGAGAP